MRRIIVAAVTTTALALPGIALAHGSEHSLGAEHHGVRHAERHHHHHRAHLLTFHAAQAPATTPSTGAGTIPRTPVADERAERAGTIASFTAGTLTITLNDGSSVSGKVALATEIECHSAMASAADNGDNGDNGGGDEHGDRSGPSAGDGQPGDDSGRDEGDHDVRDDDAHDEAEHCSPAALVPGASVREAVLSVNGAGSFWVKLEL
jgi:hypothetical protein